jgi:hypothetical protein
MARLVLALALLLACLHAQYAADPKPTPAPLAAATTPLERTLTTQNPLKLDPILPQPGKTIPIKVARKNPTNNPITETLTWAVAENSPWKIQPASQTLTCQPGQSAQANFDITLTSTSDPALAPLPQLTSVTKAVGTPDPIATQSAFLNVDLASYYQNKMVLFASKTKTPPVIDGKLDDPVWATCNPATHFVNQLATVKIPWATETRICWDDQAIYIGARLAEPDLQGIKTKITQRNGQVWTDDSFECFFDFDEKQAGFVQFIVSAANVPYDILGKRVRWDTVWTSQTGREKDAWTVEIAIPWKAMESPAPKAGDRIRFQLARNRVRDEKHTVWQWAPTFKHANRVPGKFGALMFIDAAGPAAMPVLSPTPANPVAPAP